MTDCWDAVVVGAGPAGSVSALLLARLGYRVMLTDRAHFPRTKPCGEYLSPGVGRVLTHLGLGREIELAQALSIPGMEIVGPLGERFRVQYGEAGERLCASTLRRWDLDARLLDAALEAGSELIEGFVARSPVFEDGAVVGVAGSHEGTPKLVRGKIVIVADGGRSILVRSLGLREPLRWPVRMGLVAHFVGKPNLRDGFGQMHVRPDGYCGVAPLPDGLVNVSLVVPTNALQRAHLSATALFDRWIAETPRLRACLADCRRVSPVRGVSPLGSRARRAHVSGALLVGDAAGFFDPFTGEGIYRALRGAELAVQTAHASLAVDDVSSSNLVSYDHMRMRAFGAKELVTRLVQLFVQFPSLMTYSLPRMSERQDSSRALSAVLGDIQEANISLTARALWSALRP